MTRQGRRSTKRLRRQRMMLLGAIAFLLLLVLLISCWPKKAMLSLSLEPDALFTKDTYQQLTAALTDNPPDIKLIDFTLEYGYDGQLREGGLTFLLEQGKAPYPTFHAKYQKNTLTLQKATKEQQEESAKKTVPAGDAKALFLSLGVAPIPQLSKTYPISADDCYRFEPVTTEKSTQLWEYVQDSTGYWIPLSGQMSEIDGAYVPITSYLPAYLTAMVYDAQTKQQTPQIKTVLLFEMKD